jgi:hypothetical protein
MTPPIFLLDGFSSAGIYASPSSMSIKIKENSEIECKVDIQKEVFGQLNLKIQATTDILRLHGIAPNYIYVDGTTTQAQLQISLKSVIKSRKS